MKLPYRWLEEYISSPGDPKSIAEQLLLTGSNVEKIDTPAGALEKVVVAEILEILPHPDADRLQLVKVRFGKDKTTDVVCGAPNIAVGQKVPLALPGTTLPNGMKLVITKIRGVESRGMLCAEDELGLGDDHGGILVLDNRAQVGTTLVKALGLSKAVFDVDVTPNRSDCFSIEGLAREYAACSGKKLKSPKVAKLPQAKSKNIQVTISAKKASGYYTACKVSGIVIGPSPLWMQAALREVGIRPKNNIVDITNYVMIATGQPMHAFDSSKISNKGKTAITVRFAKKGEQIIGLDDGDYKLDPSMLVIADDSNPIAIAGVIGGKASAVSEKSTEIVFEAAHFDGPTIRKTARALNIRTESSTRFEKGIAKENVLTAVAYAVELLKQTTGGKVEELVVEEVSKKSKPVTITIAYDRVARLIGETISKTKIKQLLSSLGFTVKDKPGNKAEVTVPFYRLDVSIEEDVIEEIVRMYGVNTLKPAIMHMDVIATHVDTKRSLQVTARDTLVAFGFQEVYLYSFYGDTDRKADRLSMFCDGRFDHLEVKKPLSPEQKFIRKSLLPGIIKTVVKNISTLEGEPFKLFELGKVFIPQGEKLPEERLMAAGAVTFAKVNPEKQLLYVKGVVESFLQRVNANTEYSISPLHGRGVVFEIEGKAVAMVYILSEQERVQYKVKKATTLFEISLSALEQYAGIKKTYKPYSQFPSVTRDLAVEVSPEVLWGDIKKLIKGEHLEQTTFLSQYPLEDKKSIAFRMVFRSMQETLVSENVEKQVEKITRLLKDKLDATIRGNN